MRSEPNDSRVDEGGLERLVHRIAEQNASLLERIDDLLAQNKALLARVAELEAKLGQPPKTPDNSSLPPSKGQKSNAQETAPKKGRRGRPGVARALCANPDATRNIYAKKCACGAKLSEADQPDVFAYDHLDLPPIKPITTRINLHKGQCPCCKRRVVATAPADMPSGSPFGPGIVSLVTYLHACQMVSYNRLVEMLGGLFNIEISEGAIANMLSRAQTPLAASAVAIAETVRTSPVVGSDETSARVKGRTHWQWAFGCATAVYHVIAETRGKIVPIDFLRGSRPKVWLSDRYAAQCKHADVHQHCLSHLIRDAQFAIDAGDRIFAPSFKRLLQTACKLGQRRKRMSDAVIERCAQMLRRRLDRLIDLAPTQKDGNHLRAAMQLGGRDHLFVFMSRRDVEPTNNASERNLRPSVIFRKVTNGFRSEWGAKVYADICSIVGTGRLADRSPLASLRAALATA
jgi:transposase